MMAMLLSGSAIAAPVDQQTAKEKAAAFLKKQAQHAGPRRAAALRNPQLTEAQAFGNELHIFNMADNGGFVIVSGDDRTEEILGYVEGGSFDINNIPDNMRFWLQGYADQINSLGNSTVAKAPKKETRANIAPLLVTNWDQRNDYNDMLFFDYDDTEYNETFSSDKDDYYTGCAATSMAQSLYQAAQKYKEKHGSWPSTPTTAIPSYTAKGITYKALDPYTFDWDNMLPNYARKYATPTDEQIEAVGMLMTYCGRAMHMEYGTGSSDAAFVYMPFRMTAYFGIQPYVRNMDRQYYSSQRWEDLLYNELAHERAVPYTGVSGPNTTDAGHAFVLDGYKDGLWHINWGWGQAEAINNAQYNGFFKLTVLMPQGEGAVSGGALGSEYKYLQQATIGVSFDPIEDEACVANTMYTHKGTGRGYSSYTMKVTYLNYNVLGGKNYLDGAWAIANEDGTYTILKKDYENRDFNLGCTPENIYGEYGDLASYTQSIDELPVDGIADGTYTLLHVSSLPGQDKWVADDGTDLMNFTITVNGNKIKSAVCHPVATTTTSLKVKSIEFIGDMEANKDNIVRVTIENTGDDFFGMLGMYYNTESSPTTSKLYRQLAAIKPGETTHDFTVKLPKGEYNLWFGSWETTGYANASNYFGTGKMFIGYGADANKVQVGKLEFDGQEGATTLSAKSVNGQLEEMTGTFEVVNNAANPYSNTYYVAVESSEYNYSTYKTETKTQATVEVPVTVPAGETMSVPFSLGVVTGLNASTTYTVRLYAESGDIASKQLKLTSYFRYWLADGTMKDAPEPGNYGTIDADAKANALAVDFRGMSNVKEVDNPNCVYYIDEAKRPYSSYSDLGTCSYVIDGVAENITINPSYGFYVPEPFTATQISFSRKFTNGIAKGGDPYWETIVLPFEVNSVKNGTKNLKWFKSATEKRCHFWLMELTDVSSDALTFDYAQKFEANKPYIIQVPGEGWGDSWNLAGKELVFSGINVEVPVTAFSSDLFVGTYAPVTVSGMILNSTENKFVYNDNGNVAAYNAYINTTDNANGMRIVIAGDDVATAIEGIVDNMQTADDAMYNLNGIRVSKAKKGIYIQNGKKVIVK